MIYSNLINNRPIMQVERRGPPTKLTQKKFTGLRELYRKGVQINENLVLKKKIKLYPRLLENFQPNFPGFKNVPNDAFLDKA